MNEDQTTDWEEGHTFESGHSSNPSESKETVREKIPDFSMRFFTSSNSYHTHGWLTKVRREERWRGLGASRTQKLRATSEGERLCRGGIEK